MFAASVTTDQTAKVARVVMLLVAAIKTSIIRKKPSFKIVATTISLKRRRPTAILMNKMNMICMGIPSMMSKSKERGITSRA
jgi:hypothetical protein